MHAQQIGTSINPLTVKFNAMVTKPNGIFTQSYRVFHKITQKNYTKRFV